MDDKRIIELLFLRDEAALGEIERRYGRLLGSVSLGITGNGQDAEECVNDTYLAAWNSIPPQKPENLAAYLCRIAHNLACHVLDRRAAAKCSADVLPLTEELDMLLPSSDDTASHFESRELSRAIDRFLRGQPREARVFFVRRYFYADGIPAISALTGASEAKIASSLFRTRKRLRAFLEREEFYL